MLIAEMFVDQDSKMVCMHCVVMQFETPLCA